MSIDAAIIRLPIVWFHAGYLYLEQVASRPRSKNGRSGPERIISKMLM